MKCAFTDGNPALARAPVTFAVAFLLLAGCSNSPYALAPVRGMVTIDGKPLAHGKIMFAPVSNAGGHQAGKVAVGNIQPDGTYELTTYSNGDGAIVGDHWVTLLATKADLENVADQTVPRFRRYSVRQKQSVVADMQNEIDIALTSDDVTRYGVK